MHYLPPMPKASFYWGCISGRNMTIYRSVDSEIFKAFMRLMTRGVIHIVYCSILELYIIMFL
ncbi:MAG: hypothetical protein UW07_C0017G0018 [Candidatus Nomurabacteria bacterium GW2011_GWF2_43_8]|uniref:Uncharacterized protein n=1 Tax=Candidatus Nomurabacteria bacterium GW2011_GWF2_43_8 TaxID=1618779 RepID=A0A0G1HXJ3_9BACT|nr:MAG: hypothetical protein UW07_C0017G0018 [Candidatus Nomurabacteria bacterium GW2011_GWF2_43_8]